MPETVTCMYCGTVALGRPLEWVSSVEGGRTVYYCPRCARDNLRAIEARLDSSWW
ncbi:hypothetical protein [Haloactinopolyspora alba]|uniref:hypothetical protein n=1 Tax=Haloactinopolyspora alba TaxID=648780 RepID=UPI0013EC62E2|nr:hypothetical protein [Haloactinopolyspora alba]